MKKFLIIRFSSIGDIVLTSPIIRCLKLQVIASQVHFLTKKTYSDLVENNPFIDKTFYLEDNLQSIIRQLKKEKYDYIIDLHHNLRSFRIKSALGIKSFSFPKLNFEKWLLVNFKINKLPKTHIVDRYFETLKTFGVVNDQSGLDFFIPEKEEVNCQNYSLNPDDYIAFCIGGKFATKKLPVGKIISICKKINKPIVLLGGLEDVEAGEQIVKNCPSGVINLCGKVSLFHSASLIRQSQKVLTHDTGMMHIAAAFKKEIASIWGSTVPEFGMSPYYGRYPVLNSCFSVPELSCRPCSKLGFERCPKGHFQCMNLIEEGAVSAFVND